MVEINFLVEVFLKREREKFIMELLCRTLRMSREFFRENRIY